MNRWELEQKIVLRALKDPAFKKKLLAQPSEALREFLQNEKGMDLTTLKSLNVRVVEEKNQEWVLAIPYLAAEMGSLSDEEVERLVAGCGCGTNAYSDQRL